MDVEMNKIMDEIMNIMHQIGTYLSDYALAEMNGREIKRQQIENNEILKTLFERIQKEYRKLQELITEDTESINIEEDDRDLELLNFQKPESIMNETMNILDEYLEMAYTELRYISIVDGEGNEINPSIYKNTKFEKIRNAEYDLQSENLEKIIERRNIKNPIGEFSFKEKGYILSYMTEEKFYEYAFKQIERYISDLGKRTNEIDPRIYENTRNKLIEQKYILYFSHLNNRYNGILQENDVGKYAIIKNYIDEKLETMLLDMSNFEIEENIKANLLENKKDFKEIIKSIIEKEKIASRKTKSKNNDLSKADAKKEKNGDKGVTKVDGKSDLEK